MSKSIKLSIGKYARLAKKQRNKKIRREGKFYENMGKRA